MGRKNPVQHVEWRTKDAARLKDFYGSIFDWKFMDWMPGYIGIDFGQKDAGGGIFSIPEGQPIPTGVSNFITVEELEPYEEQIKAKGGQVMMSGQEVPNVGRFTMFTDPDGNALALWQQFPPSKEQEKAARKAAKKEKKAAKKAAKKEKKAAKKGKKK